MRVIYRRVGTVFNVGKWGLMREASADTFTQVDSMSQLREGDVIRVYEDTGELVGGADGETMLCKSNAYKANGLWTVDCGSDPHSVVTTLRRE